MSRQVNGHGDWFLTRKQEEAFNDGLRQALISERPNPDRIGCPDTNIIRDLAFHKKILDAAGFMRVTNHLAECSPCVQDALVYAEQYQYEKSRRRTRKIAMGVAAALMLAVATWAFLRLPQRQEIVNKAPSVSKPSPAPLVAETGNRTNPPSPLPALEAVTIEIPPTYRGPAPSRPPLILPRGRLSIEVHLHVGSPAGHYKMRILDKAGIVRTTVTGIAHTSAAGLTSMKVAVDTSTLSPGKYSLSILKPGLDEWSDYLLVVKRWIGSLLARHDGADGRFCRDAQKLDVQVLSQDAQARHRLCDGVPWGKPSSDGNPDRL